MSEEQPYEGLSQKRLDRLLLGSMGLSVFAAAFEVIVGFSVAHRVTLTSSKMPGYAVCAIALGLCLLAGLIALRVRTQVTGADQTEPRGGRQLFMANLNLLTAGLVGLLVVAGTLVLVILRPDF
jgi:mannose/fructose/N-acetylgalactosamine-specific phosphotransferase system component IID